MNSNIRAFFQALGDPMSYNIRTNKYILFGFLWGTPVPLFLLWFNKIFWPHEIFQLINHEPAYLILFAHPVLSAIVFGALGTIHLRLIKDLEYQSTHDELTGLYNYRYFRENFENFLKTGQKTKKSFALSMIDIDHLKKVNDRHNHLAGSQVIKEVAQKIEHNARENDVVCQYGGDEYVVIMPNTNMDDAENLLNKIRVVVEQNDFGVDVNVTISAGIAMFPQDGKSYNKLLRIADKRLFEAKNRGRNRVVS